MREITADDVEDLAVGAVVLGTGGGGDPYVAKLMAQEAIQRHGPVQLLDATDLDPDGLVLPTAVVGAPTVMTESFPHGRELANALPLLEQRLGAPVIALMPGEVGGMNTLFPVAMAARLGLPVVDADLIRRAFPKLEMTVLTIAGVSASPITVSDVDGNHTLVEARDNESAERVVRTLATAAGMLVVAGVYPMTAGRCAELAIPGSLSYCGEIGRLVRDVQRGLSNAYAAFLDFCDAQIVFTGKLVDIERTTAAGFVRGAVTLQHLDDPERVLRVDIQNENLAAFEDDRPIVTVPDLITLIDVETATPMTTESLAYGQRLHVLAMPAHELWRTPEGIGLAGPRTFGYDFDYVRFEESIA